MNGKTVHIGTVQNLTHQSPLSESAMMTCGWKRKLKTDIELGPVTHYKLTAAPQIVFSGLWVTSLS